VASALLLESLQFPVQPAGIFFLDTGHVHHTPDPLFPVMVADQQTQELLHIHAVRLGPAGSTIHCDT
jgi:hypothetical protein